MDDWDLLQSWQQGDTTAGQALVKRYTAPITRFFRSRVNSEVEDLVQRTFVAAVEGRDRIRGTSFRGYLYGIARLQLLVYFRRKQRGLQETDFSVRSIADLGTTPTQRIARQDRNAALRAAMAAMPVDAQIALQLHYWEGLSAQEIGEVIGVEPSTVRSQLTRARDRLRKLVDSNS